MLLVIDLMAPLTFPDFIKFFNSVNVENFRNLVALADVVVAFLLL